MARRTYGNGSVFQRAQDGIWVATIEAGFTPTGKRRQLRYYAKTRRGVLDKIAAARKEIALNGLPTDRAGTITVAVWATKWLSLQHTRVRPQTFAKLSGAITKWIIPLVGTRKLTALTPGDVRRIADGVIQAGGRTSTAATYQSIFIQCLRAAQNEGYTIARPVFNTVLETSKRTTRTAIPVDQALAILKIVIAREDAARWVAALLQGMRQGEPLYPR